MDLKELERHWDRLGSTDPFWAVLTDPDKRNNKWDPEEFFLSGRREISAVLKYIGSRRYDLRKGKALDFGCGVGRLTQALCDHFSECVGVDISPSMIRLAEKYNSYGPKCRYFVNRASNLELFAEATFDFIYSGLVLQHMEPVYSMAYIQEFFRLLSPGGMAVFQIPSGPLVPAHPIFDSTFRARISVQQESLKTEAGKALTLQVTVQNVSSNRWPVCSVDKDGGVFSLGNHWLDGSGSVLALDDGRVTLPKSVEPQEEVAVQLTVNTPSRPGTYFLELDMVLEGVCWFKDKGSATLRLVVEVEDSGSGEQSKGDELAPDASRRATFVPSIEMYGIPKERILSLTYASGCDVLEAQEDFSGAPGWVGHRYFITKPGPETAGRLTGTLRGRPMALLSEVQALSQKLKENKEDYARNFATHAEQIRQLEVRTAGLEEQYAKQKIELEWLYRWIPVNKLARSLFFGRNLRKRLKEWLHFRL